MVKERLDVWEERVSSGVSRNLEQEVQTILL
jgi:hypothetical protein